MGLSTLPYDVWGNGSSVDKITLDVLMPNGLLIPLTVKKDITLFEIKEDAWEEAQKLPLYGLLHDMQTYIFRCINQTTSEQEELMEENKRICDVRPFQAVLRLVEKKGDKAETQLNAQIGLLIGKGLHEFDALKNPEVNDFRWRMRLACNEWNQNYERKTWMEKLCYKYPLQVEKSSELPPFLLKRIKEGNIVVTIRLECSEMSFKFCVSHSTKVSELLEYVLYKKSFLCGLTKESVAAYLLKISGREEFLFKDYPLSQYKYIRQMISDEKTSELIMISKASVELEHDNVYESIDDIFTNKTSTVNGAMTLSRKKTYTISAWTIQDPFIIKINGVCKLNCEDEIQVAVQAGLCHGGELLCELQSTTEAVVLGGEAEWGEELKFDLEVCNIPRMTRLCLVVYEVAHSIKGIKARKYRSMGPDLYVNPIAWVNTTVYDFKNILKTGTVTLHMWWYSYELQNDDLLNPLGTVVANPDLDNATGLTLTFQKYHSSHPVSYPPLNKILDYAKEHLYEDTDGIPHHASKAYLKHLSEICAQDPLHQMHEQDKDLLWFLRQDCLRKFPHSLPKLLRSLKWYNHHDVAEVTALLQEWEYLPPEQTLELLDYAYADQAVRSFAVKCLEKMSDEDLSLYLLQLVQALKHESYLYCDLVQFLLCRALRNQHLGHQLFWLLRSEMHVPSVSVRFGLLLEAYCRGAVEHMKSLSKQVEALKKFKAVNKLIHVESFKRKETKEKLRFLMQEALTLNCNHDVFIGLHCPLQPVYKVHKLRIEKCRFMDSKMKPLWLVCENSDSFCQDIYMIYKNGDDLRQDMLTLQMIRIMDKMWKEEGLDFRMIPYQCISTDYNEGLIEVVLNAETIANIQKEKGFSATSAFKKGSLLAWLKDHNPDEKSLNKAVEEFTLSCAGYCVATYVLGIADRHSDNIMVKTNGQLFHIDFGHILGNFKEKFGIRRERVPFVLTNDFVYVITRGSSQKNQAFCRFQEYCEEAFMILRRKGTLIISLFAMMLSTGIPELTSEKDLYYLRETLVLDKTELEALQHFRSKFMEALQNSWKTSLNWLAHNLAKDNKISD
ncbi:phosphatidylinositol 4,5-bisphosphate 3-kinase catalytic subunit beta isoform-like isoform X4 [Tachypleus tridentatus]|uniref:phosphatidylinositol 4,5-bisphosphate 3-kinase catalytic subunit beta isoform-like isoform X4 n=1 Tax=Tachypleus tridentatus TaxID=6853 RepID=UPI003FD279C3